MQFFIKLILIIILTFSNFLSVRGNISPSKNFNYNINLDVTNTNDQCPIEPRSVFNSNIKKSI